MGEGAIPTLVGTLNFNSPLSKFNGNPKISCGAFLSDNQGINRGEEEKWAGPYINVDCHNSSEFSPKAIEMEDASPDPNIPNCMAMQLSHANPITSNFVVQVESNLQVEVQLRLVAYIKRRR